MSRFLGLELDSQGEGDGDDNFDKMHVDAEPSSKKDKRALKKQRKLVAEFEVTMSNDELKRPGQLLDSPEAKKLRIDPGDKKKLSPEELKALKKLLAERKKVLTQLPRFLLQGAGITSSISATNPHDLREPIFMSDVQHLLLYALGGNSMIHPPNRWCNLQKAQRLTHVVTLVVEGLTTKDFLRYEHLFPKLTSHFKDRVEVMAPAYYGRDVAQELSCIPLSNAQKEAILKKYGSMEKAISEKEIVKQFRALFPTKMTDDSLVAPSLSVKAADLPNSDIFPRTYLLMGLNQMTFEGYPMPFWMQLGSKCADYQLSKPEYKEVSARSPMFAIDCEMCITASNPSELTRIAVINEDNKVVYESYVKPKEKILNYLTQFSGITEEKLKDVTITLEDVQQALIRLLPEDAIWIGQSLNCDLHALKMMHPYVIDTSLIFNLSGIAGRKSKLSHMADVFLKEEIQAGKHGHCPIEDAKAAMKLVKLKLSQGFLFGDNLNATDDPAIPESVLATSIFNRAYKSEKTVAVIGPERVLQEYENVTMTPDDGTAFTSLKVSKNKEVINKITEIATSHQLTIAHVDVSSKLEKSSSDHTKKEKLLQKVDKWCDTVYNHVSINGMCVIVFTGPKSVSLPTKNQTNNSTAAADDDSSSNSSSEKSTPTATSSEIQEQESSSLNIIPALPNPNQQPKKRNKPRRNGVCFIRINTLKV